MPKIRRHTASTTQELNNNGFDRNTPSTWHLASLEQLRTTTVAVLQKELRSRNLPLKGNKSVLSSCLYESLHPTTSDEVLHRATKVAHPWLHQWWPQHPCNIPTKPRVRLAPAARHFTYCHHNYSHCPNSSWSVYRSRQFPLTLHKL